MHEKMAKYKMTDPQFSVGGDVGTIVSPSNLSLGPHPLFLANIGGKSLRSRLYYFCIPGNLLRLLNPLSDFPDY